MMNLRPRLKQIPAVLGAAMLLAGALGAARADERVKGDVQVMTDGGYARLVFRFQQEVPVSIRVSFPIVIMTFKKPVDVAVDRLNISASGYISAARIDPDGSAIRIALARQLKVHSIPAAEPCWRRRRGWNPTFCLASRPTGGCRCRSMPPASTAAPGDRALAC